MFGRIRRHFCSNLVLKRVGNVLMMETKANYASGLRQNKLANQKSSYLLQHATNPVDWYPWGKEALARAKEENKMIFLSVGYSTCHWCHVMERESFENEEIAKILNDKFISIKVDREERPDVDKVYMTYVQATQGSGGWPMSVWLTPDLKPVYGGTYYPPDNRYFGSPGFKTILMQLAEKWEKDSEKISELGTNVLDELRNSIAVRLQSNNVISADKVMDKILQQFQKMYEPEFGGFGESPKFPQAVNFDALYCVHFAKATENDSALRMCLHTLQSMAKGGIHDHIGKGFHRYSTDKQWHVPHFEKMLYDQAQLVNSYLDAFLITGDRDYSDVARGILEYVIRDLSAENGGFYCAEDADSSVNGCEPQSDKKEGSFYVWTHEEVKDILVKTLDGRSDVTFAEVFCKHYDVRPDGNVNPYQDPHDELKGKNVLIVRESETETARHFGIDVKTLREILEECRRNLLDVRSRRPRPHLDDKIVTSWNGLTISAFARAAQVLDDDRFANIAKKAANHLRSNHFDESVGMLLRATYQQRESQSTDKIYGFLDDYAFTIQAALDVYETCYDASWLDWAFELQRKQDELFWDPQHAAYFSCDPRDEEILLQLKEDQDGAEPSGNSIAVRNLLRLNAYFDLPDSAEKVDEMLKYFGGRLLQIPATLPAMLRALIMHTKGVRQIVICGNAESERCRGMLRVVHSMYLPDRVLLVVDESSMAQGHLEDRIRKLGVKAGAQDVAYVCHGFSCSLPLSSAHHLQELLGKPN